MKEIKEPVPFIADMREAGIYHQVQMVIDPKTFEFQLLNPSPLQPLPVESVTECSGIQASIDCIDKTFSFVNDKNLSDFPRKMGAQFILERITKELQSVAAQCDADYILISDPEVLENTERRYRICIHYMLMVRT